MNETLSLRNCSFKLRMPSPFSAIMPPSLSSSYLDSAWTSTMDRVNDRRRVRRMPSLPSSEGRLRKLHVCQPPESPRVGIDPPVSFPGPPRSFTPLGGRTCSSTPRPRKQERRLLPCAAVGDLHRVRGRRVAAFGEEQAKHPRHRFRHGQHSGRADFGRKLKRPFPGRAGAIPPPNRTRRDWASAPPPGPRLVHGGPAFLSGGPPPGPRCFQALGAAYRVRCGFPPGVIDADPVGDVPRPAGGLACVPRAAPCTLVTFPSRPVETRDTPAAWL